MKKIEYVAVAGLLCACCINYATAKQYAPTTNPNQTFKDGYILPKATYLKALGLNFDTFTSSIVWVAGLLYYGEYRYSKNKKSIQPPRHLRDYASTMVNIDPLYEKPYHWFASTYLLSRKQVVHEDLEHINAFMDVAIERFPNKSIYPYDAGMHYIGYSIGRDPAVRIKELEKGIKYLEKASQFNDVSEDVPFTVGYMYRLKGSLERELRGEDVNAAENAQAQRQFYMDLYKTTGDGALRARLQKKLIAVGVTKKQIQALEPIGRQALQKQYASTRSYLSLDLWLLIDSFEDSP